MEAQYLSKPKVDKEMGEAFEIESFLTKLKDRAWHRKDTPPTVKL
jgi:hypothetical protein